MCLKSFSVKSENINIVKHIELFVCGAPNKYFNLFYNVLEHIVSKIIVNEWNYLFLSPVPKVAFPFMSSVKT